jgi:protein required for attachment to host cells
VDWLKRQMASHGIDHLVVVAPPRFTGVLRKTKFAQSNPLSIIQHREDLVNLPTRKLAEHATIRGLVVE